MPYPCRHSDRAPIYACFYFMIVFYIKLWKSVCQWHTGCFNIVIWLYLFDAQNIAVLAFSWCSHLAIYCCTFLLSVVQSSTAVHFSCQLCSHLLLCISLVYSHLLLCSSLTSAVVYCLVHFLNKCILLLLCIPVKQAVVCVCIYIFPLCSHLLLSAVHFPCAVIYCCAVPCAVVYCLVHFLNKCIFYCCTFPLCSLLLLYISWINAFFYCCAFPLCSHLLLYISWINAFFYCCAFPLFSHLPVCISLDPCGIIHNPLI